MVHCSIHLLLIHKFNLKVLVYSTVNTHSTVIIICIVSYIITNIIAYNYPDNWPNMVGMLVFLINTVLLGFNSWNEACDLWLMINMVNVVRICDRFLVLCCVCVCTCTCMGRMRCWSDDIFWAFTHSLLPSLCILLWNGIMLNQLADWLACLLADWSETNAAMGCVYHHWYQLGGMYRVHEWESFRGER